MEYNTKTPQFDEAIQIILDDLVPHRRECLWSSKNPHCEKSFSIEKEDIEFLRMFRVPPPDYCPTCRRIMRLTHMGTMKLFYRNCSVPTHTEKMISIFGEHCPFPVYDYSYFIGDSFDPMSFGKTFDVHTSVLDQLLDLRKVFPMPSFLNRDPSSVNSEYSNGGRNNKNCYLCSGCYSCEDMSYTNMANKSKKVFDSRIIKDSEYVYQGIASDHLYRCSYVYFSKSCIDSMFLFDCRNCTNCFGCVNLRNKSYCIWNIQYTKEEYEKIIGEFKPFKRSVLEKIEKKFWDFVKTVPMNASQNISTTDSIGVLLEQSNQVYDCVDTFKSQNIRHGDGCIAHQDSMDLLFSGGSNHLYMTTNIGSQSSHVKFSISSKFCTDCEFIFNCKNLSNCFMCFGIQNKSYCIGNIQYTEEVYFQKVDEIKTAMLQHGEYGQPLPLEFSAQAYNFSLASAAFPITDAQVVALGGYIEYEPESNASNISIIESEHIPDSLEDVPTDILEQALRCKVSSKPFKIIESELDFYRYMSLPLPDIHPTIRMNTNYKIAINGKMYNTLCNKCSKEIKSIFDSKDGYTLYCEECYKREVL